VKTDINITHTVAERIVWIAKYAYPSDYQRITSVLFERYICHRDAR